MGIVRPDRAGRSSNTVNVPQVPAARVSPIRHGAVFRGGAEIASPDPIGLPIAMPAKENSAKATPRTTHVAACLFTFGNFFSASESLRCNGLRFELVVHE